MRIEIFDYEYFTRDDAAKNVLSQLEKIVENVNGVCIYREPEIITEGNELPTFTILTEQNGIQLLKCYSLGEDELTKIEPKYWEINGTKVVSEFIKFRNYSHWIKTKLNDPINEVEDEIIVNVLYYFPFISSTKLDRIADFRNLLRDNEKLLSSLDELFLDQDKRISKNMFDLAESVILSSNILNKSSDLYVESPAKNLAEAIALNNKKISRFDSDQLKASLVITNEPERIRGLAGSGKTVLLAIKAARFHKRHPDKKIAFVFYTKSLYNQAINLIRKHYIQIANKEPNWENLLILHSWGGTNTGEGFYTYVCKSIGCKAKPFNGSNSSEVWSELCENANTKPIFDAILVDEAQDFPLPFFELAEKVLKTPKKIVIAYDDLQTTNDVKIPDFEILFGSKNNQPNITLKEEFDYVLKKSYRNSMECLVTAIGFGFGFYSELTQMIQETSTWDAIGFDVKGDFKPGNLIEISRRIENSPNDITSQFNDILPVTQFTLESDTYVSESIIDIIYHLISEETVNPKDIVVIDIKMNKDKILNSIQAGLYLKGIDSHIPGIISDSRNFFRENTVTLSTPRNSKGNEVPIVIVIGCEELYTKKTPLERRQIRNFMFISMTRSLGWVYLVASGRVKTAFLKEYSEIKRNYPKIRFTYPSIETLERIKKVDYLSKNPNSIRANQDLINMRKILKNNNTEMLKKLLELDLDMLEDLKRLVADD